MNTGVWTQLFERYGVPTQQSAGPLDMDPFYTMAKQAREMVPTAEPARVAISLSTASDDYSKQRFTVTITCPCPSTEAHISFLTEASFILAKRMVNQGADAVGLPRLGE